MDKPVITVQGEDEALLHVDIQTAFMPEHIWRNSPVLAGGLPVPGGQEILPVVLQVTRLFPDGALLASLDSHPEDARGSPSGHISWVTSYVGLPVYHNLTLKEVLTWTDGRHIVSKSFGLEDLKSYLAGVPRQEQTLWPKHAVSGTPGAKLHPALRGLRFQEIIFKGQDARCDSYSAVRDNLGRPTGLVGLLMESEIRRVFVDGLAYTHCVGWTALDLAAAGFETFVIRDATRSVPIPGLEDEMTRQLLAAGVRLIDSDQLQRGW